MKLIYVGDPMCSWCYGFGKELSAFVKRVPDLPLEIVVGGVRAGATDLLDEAGKRFRLQHWTRVAQASGLPFDRDAFSAHKNFVYDTEPVCRAVVAARMLAPNADLLSVFRALQHAFYAEGRNTTDGEVLAEIGTAALGRVGFAVDAQQFHDVWASQQAIAATQADFKMVGMLNVSGFPALFYELDGKLHRIAAGYTTVDVLEEKFDAIERAVAR